MLLSLKNTIPRKYKLNKKTPKKPRHKGVLPMERKYFDINEKAAESALHLWSFNTYVRGSETQDYKKQVDKAYSAAEQTAENRPEQAEKAFLLAERFSKKYAEHLNTGFQIELMCPSILISGAGNFPVSKKEKQNKRREKHINEYHYIMGMIEKIKSLGISSNIIKSSDENALEQLQEKVYTLTEELERCKAMNKFYRKNGTLQGFEGLSNEQAIKLDKTLKEVSTYNNTPYASFTLTNIRAKIKAAEGRIREITRIKEQAETRTEQEQAENLPFEMIENADIMRLQLVFDGKPNDKTRNILKSNGFKWAPSQNAWQRQLTDNAKYAYRRIKQNLIDAMQEN